MCGLFARFRLRHSGTLPSAQSILDSLISIKHRGPDDSGLAMFSRLAGHGRSRPAEKRVLGRRELCSAVNIGDCFGALGHVRLSILDLSANGFQPMSSDDGRLTIVYNGEIYNFRELRTDLEARCHRFRSTGDTEVFLKAYQEWGNACFDMFNGEWAAIIYDAHTNTLIVSRDRFGIKPLYFYKSSNEIIFGSEVKAILAQLDVPAPVNEMYLEGYLSFGDAAWSEDTAFENIKKFPKAHFCEIDLDAGVMALRPQEYWKVSIDLSSEKFSHARAKHFAERFYDLIDDAVRIRMRSDVPVGVSLSGGLDSSIVAYLAKQHHVPTDGEGELQSYSVVRPMAGRDSCDESEFINLVVDRLGLRANYTSPVPTRIPGLLDKVCRYYEAPVNGLGVAGLFTIEAAHKAGIKVTLDGQGADEQLAGYSKFAFSFLNELSVQHFLSEAVWLMLVTDEKRMATKQIMKSLQWRVRKGLGLATKDQGPQPLNATLNESIDGGLMNLIHYADRRSMIYSMESRMPFLDHRIVEFNASVPGVYKIRKGFTKYYARLAFDGLLPDKIVWRRDKNGWNVPEREWLDNELRSWTDGLFEKFNSSVFEKKRLTKISGKSLEHRIRVINLMHFLRSAG